MYKKNSPIKFLFVMVYAFCFMPIWASQDDVLVPQQVTENTTTPISTYEAVGVCLPILAIFWFLFNKFDGYIELYAEKEFLNILKDVEKSETVADELLKETVHVRDKAYEEREKFEKFKENLVG